MRIARQLGRRVDEGEWVVTRDELEEAPYTALDGAAGGGERDKAPPYAADVDADVVEGEEDE